MEENSRLGEPVVDRHVEMRPVRSLQKKAIGPSFFTLSGGILRRDPRVANSIDAMLSRMLEEPAAATYSPHVDKNLDLLHTHLQLDMISMAAEDYVPEDECTAAEDEDVELS